MNALELRKEYLQSAVEILYPTAQAALADASPFAHFPPSSFFQIKGDGSVSYEEENTKLLESLKKEFARYGLPSNVFFDQAKKLGAMPATMLPQMFFRDELGRVYESYCSRN